MSDKRLIDANALLREMRNSGRAAYMLVIDAPTIDPKELLSMLWRNSKADPPKEDDAGQYGKVIVWYKRAEATLPMLWWMVEESADKYPYWMPMPEPPEEE